MFHYFFKDFMVFCLKVLAIGFLLISCSGDGKSESKSNGTGGATGNEGTVGTKGNAEGGTAHPVSAGLGLTAGSGPSSNSTHWILSVPFQRIEAGSFIMGSPRYEGGRDDDEDQVRVQITKPFEIMTTEVTQSQWVRVMGKNPSHFKLQEHCADHTSGMCPNRPVEQVSWDDVQEFIRKLNEALGLSGCDRMPSSSKGCYRLPTEAEWEYSARAGTETAYSFGKDHSKSEKYAWYEDNSDRKTHKVGLKKPNFWGLYDMHGNVWEWVQDSYTDSILSWVIRVHGAEIKARMERAGDKTVDWLEDPLVTYGLFRVFRGGGWYGNIHNLRSADRYYALPTLRDEGFGFRLVRTL